MNLHEITSNFGMIVFVSPDNAVIITASENCMTWLYVDGESVIEYDIMTTDNNPFTERKLSYLARRAREWYVDCESDYANNREYNSAPSYTWVEDWAANFKTLYGVSKALNKCKLEA